MAATSVAALRDIATQLRIDSVASTSKAGSGHPTTCLSAADIMSVLFFSEMHFDPKNPQNPDNDRFVLSKGHAAPILYAAWAEAGLFPRERLMELRTFESDLEGHPTPRLPFVDVATGSLGQGICAAVGIALNARRIGSGYRTYVLLGDGEIAEGSVWEAADAASHYKLDNLCAIVDANALGQSQPTEFRHDLDRIAARWSAFGWKAIVVDGHDIADIQKGLETARATTGQPTALVARTIKGKGLSAIAGKEGWHGKALKSGEETDKALKELESQLTNTPAEGPIPGPRNRGRADVPPDYSTLPAPSYKLGDVVATREAWGTALAAVGKLDTRIVALDADVKNSTFSDRFEKVAPDRFFEMFIAEQGMVGTAMGFAARGAIPFPSTFACFLYRAADFIRMAGISMLNLKLTGSHAGVSIGEDGPSQMALEDLGMMRAIPGAVVLYPCEAMSTERLVAEMAQHKGLSYMRTSRPKTPVLYGPEERFPIGGSKVLRQSADDVAVVVGAGITVFEALKAHDLLKAEGISIRVIDAYSVQPIDKGRLTSAAHAAGGVVIVVVAADGTGRRAISGDGEARWPSWTRDGRVIFSRRHEGRWRLYASALDGKAPVRLFGESDSDDQRQASVSPDGKQVAYISDRGSEDGDVDVWVASLSPAGGTRAHTQVTRIRGDEASPSWAPDGSRIAFFGVRSGVSGVWVTSIDPGARPADDPVLVSRTGGTPAWSPDGRRIAIADVPSIEPAYNGNPLRNQDDSPPLFSESYHLRFVDAPLPVDSGARTVSLPKASSSRYTAAFDRVWETLRRLYYSDGAGAAQWGALKAKYRPAAAGARDDGQLETVVDQMIAEQPLIKPAVTSNRAVVVSGHPLASRAGADALERGGNIVDAAIAVSFALGVLEPDASGIGGDGMAVLYLKGMNEPVVIDYKDQAPGRATRDNPLLQRGSADGPAAANIPGVVAGLDYLYRRYGSKKISWADLLAPAIRHADEGYTLDTALPTTIGEGRRYFAKYPAAAKIYLPDGQVPAAGQRFVNKDYASTLRAIARDGASAFYRGGIARRIADDMAQNGGLITLDDLAQYRAIERTPLTGDYRGYRVFSAPPPVATGAALIETLQILQNYPAKPGAAYSRDPGFLHHAIESWKVRDTGPRIADPALWDVTLGPHLEPSHAATLFKRIDPSKASRTGSQEGEGGTPERIGRGTTAFTVADADGSMIAVTQTLSTWGGTFYVSNGLGFLYNNHLRFNAGTAAGRFLPLARSSSTSAPTLLFRRATGTDGPGVPVLAVAAAGNNWIPASVYNIILNVVDAGMPAQAAVEAPRFLIGRDPADPDGTRIQIEDRIPRAVLQDLAGRGHRFQKIGRKGEVRYGYAAAVVIDPERRELQAGSEPRRSHGAAAPSGQ